MAFDEIQMIIVRTTRGLLLYVGVAVEGRNQKLPKMVSSAFRRLVIQTVHHPK